MTIKTKGLLAIGATAVLISGCGVTGMFRDREDLIATTSTCAEQRFEIYFQESQARLTPEAQALIGATATALEGCDIRRVRVLGLSDAIGGTGQSNLTLSQSRAQVVAEAFEAAGWPVPAFEVEAAGAAGAVTASGAQEPLRRRTEVIVDAVAR